jgi:hypothetical protein
MESPRTGRARPVSNEKGMEAGRGVEKDERTQVGISTMTQAQLFDAGSVAKKKLFVHGSHNLSGKIEWYTPLQYIVSARNVMGSIDLDPCTSEYAQKTIQAATYYTIETDGLAHPWAGTVWMNPPYASKIITAFVDKLLGHLSNGDVTQAILLTHGTADARWFHLAASRAAVVCFTRGRVRFYDEKGTANSPTHGHVFMYFGRRRQRFVDEFRQYGWIATGVS